MSIKINSLELENVKRVKLVKLEPTEKGLTIMAGNNNQGKTSILDAIAWALGGNKFKPSKAQREGSSIPPKLNVELSNGVRVERSGINGDLKVMDSSGNKAGQALLNSFLSELALDIPKFMNQSSKDKARTLLDIIGVGEELFQLDAEEDKLMDDRRLVGRNRDQKENHANEMVFHKDVPSELVSAKELIDKQQSILAKNGENQRLRQNAEFLKTNHAQLLYERDQLTKSLQKLNEQIELSSKDLEVANKTALDLHDESTAELEESINNIDVINSKIRENLNREVALDEFEQYKNEYDNYTHQIESIRDKRMGLLKGADLPLKGLSVEDGELTFNGQQWDNMSGSEQLRVATAIVRRLNPDCGFVLLDKLEQFDPLQLKTFAEWLEAEGLQAIGTRVGSSGHDNEIIIEDGYVKGSDIINVSEPIEEKGWKFE